MSKVMVQDVKNEVRNASTLIVHFQTTLQVATAYWKTVKVALRE